MPLRADMQKAFDRLEESRALFEGGSFFLTGGTGFFGKWMLHFFAHLVEREGVRLRVTVLSRDPEAFLRRYPVFDKPWLRFVRGDIRTFTWPREPVTFVMHMAATAAEETFAGHDPLDKLESSAFGTARVLALARERGVKKFLYVSSGSVYGKACGKRRISERCPTAPDVTGPVAAALPEGKRIGEFYASYYARQGGMDVTIARCFTFVGAYLPTDIHYAAGNFFRDALKGGPVVVRGDGRAVRSYLYMGDLPVWLLRIMFHARCGAVYNVGSDEEINMAALAEKIAAMFGVGVCIEGKKGGPETASADHYVPDIDKARRDLGLAVWTPLDEALKKTAESMGAV